MSKYLGYNKLKSGCVKYLTYSELKRHYFYISTNRKVKELKKLDIFINSDFLGKKTIDCSGRVFLGKSIVNKISDKKINLVLNNDSLYINF